MDAGHPALRHHQRRGRRTSYREGAAFGPDVPGGSRQMTEGELAPLRSRADERQAVRQDAVAHVHERFGDLLVAKAAQLASGGAVTITTTVGTVEARIVRFRRGDSVLEIKTECPSSRHRTAGKNRLTNGQLNDTTVLAGYLADSVADLGSEVDIQDGPAT
jgi:hypothetical protein